jgi:acetoacetyl-CoA synthetase
MKELWSPSHDALQNTAMGKMMNRQLGPNGPRNYAEYHKWSVDHFKEFWKSLLWESNLVFVGTPEAIYIPAEGGRLQGGKWFPDIDLNYAQNLLNNSGALPLIGILEDGSQITYTRDKLLSDVKAVQAYLIERGVKKGDRVAAYVANVPQAVVAMLATTSLGAVWSSCSPDFGHQGVLDRFGQIEPKVLFVVDGYIYNQKRIEMRAKNDALVKSLPSVTDVIEIGVLQADGSRFDRICSEYASEGSIEFELCNFSDPLFIMYSSGTTGVPKSMVHSVGGTLLQIYKEHRMHCDLKEGEKILYYTTCGWMMWNWLVTAMACGATVICFDGSPMSPGTDSLWQLVKREKVDVFGTSAKFIGACRQAKLDLRMLGTAQVTRLVLSTGSPLLPEDFDYFYSLVDPGHRIQLSSICGGTDIISCFMLGNPISPVIRSEIQGPGLGLDIAAFDDDGVSLVGERGELVCRNPFPSMPVAFLADPDGAKYQSAYFERFKGVWHHGDFISIEPSGGIVVYGRSDATLNPGGVRIGSAEIYRAVETLAEIHDSLVVGYPKDGDEKVVLFLKLAEGACLSAELEGRVRLAIRNASTPRHVPFKIFAVEDVPYTISGKKVELAVKKILSGLEPKNTDALANPASLEIYRNLRLELDKT